MDFAAYHKAIAADDAWQVALELRFGNKASLMRYLPEGKQGDLAPLEAAKQAADAEWLSIMKASR